MAVDSVIMEETLRQLETETGDLETFLPYLDFVCHLFGGIHWSSIILRPRTVRAPFMSKSLEHAVRAEFVELS